MSRCFPYVRWNVGSGGGGGGGGKGCLIEPIELQKGREKAQNNDKKKHKDKKLKDKKHKHKEEKERPKEGGHCGKKRSHVESFPSTSHEDCVACPSRVKDDVQELLERSSLTEEHGPPSFRGNPYDSDKSQNSSKRLNTAATAPIISVSVAGRSSNGHRRFCLKLKISADAVVSCQQLKESESRGVSNVPIAIASSLTETTVTQEALVLLDRNAGHMEQKPSLTVAEPCFSGRTVAAGIERHLEQPPIADAGHQAASQRRHLSRAEKMEMRYGSLTAKWLPLPLTLELPDLGDESWLFGLGDSAARPLVKPCGVDAGAPTDVATSTGSALQPCACYLPDIDAYSLPYVIPF